MSGRFGESSVYETVAGLRSGRLQPEINSEPVLVPLTAKLTATTAAEATFPQPEPVPGRMIRFTVEAQPVPMARPRVAVRGGRAHGYIPAKTAQAAWEIRQCALVALGDQEPLSGALRVGVVAYLRQPASIPKRDKLTAMPTRRPDLDNYIKTALDGCSPLWVDDSQVVDLHASKRYTLTGSPRWEIEVASLEGQP